MSYITYAIEQLEQYRKTLYPFNSSQRGEGEYVYQFMTTNPNENTVHTDLSNKNTNHFKSEKKNKRSISIEDTDPIENTIHTNLSNKNINHLTWQELHPPPHTHIHISYMYQ